MSLDNAVSIARREGGAHGIEDRVTGARGGVTELIFGDAPQSARTFHNELGGLLDELRIHAVTSSRKIAVNQGIGDDLANGDRRELRYIDPVAIAEGHSDA